MERDAIPLVLAACALAFLAGPARAQGKPNILVIWGDDIGLANEGTP